MISAALLLAVVIVVGGQAVPLTQRHGMASIPDFCSGVGVLDNMEDLLSAAYSAKIGSQHVEVEREYKTRINNRPKIN